jgi:hypothetical protein
MGGYDSSSGRCVGHEWERRGMGRASCEVECPYVYGPVEGGKLCHIDGKLIKCG